MIETQTKSKVLPKTVVLASWSARIDFDPNFRELLDFDHLVSQICPNSNSSQGPSRIWDLTGPDILHLARRDIETKLYRRLMEKALSIKATPHGDLVVKFIDQFYYKDRGAKSVSHTSGSMVYLDSGNKLVNIECSIHKGSIVFKDGKITIDLKAFWIFITLLTGSHHFISNYSDFREGFLQIQEDIYSISNAINGDPKERNVLEFSYTQQDPDELYKIYSEIYNREEDYFENWMTNYSLVPNPENDVSP